MRSGDLFFEVSSSNQATALIKLQKLAHLDITVAPHSNLNFSRGVISPADFLNVSTEEIKENMKAQKVCDVKRITIRRYGQVLNTKHLILTFSTPDLPQTVKMAYIRCPVRPYIPNPLRCFQCQRYTVTLKTSVGANLPALVAGNRATTAQIARRVVLSRTPVSGKSYADAARKSTSDNCIQCTVGTDSSSDSATPTNSEVIAKSKSNSPPKTKVIAEPPNKSLPPAKKTIIKRTQSDSPKRPKSRRARQRDQRPTLARIPKKISRDFHRKIEQDTLTGYCSEDDEALMDIQSGTSTFSSGGGASVAL
ncbi:uncharacterized protein TNCV_4008741 [Trichonephila clavipes]|nr:uncharacterized protein TNCV_4008741 [Trichonephila clavipes]